MFAPAQPKLAASRSNVRQQQPQQQQSQNRKEGQPPIPDPTELPSFLMSLSQIEDPRLAASQQAHAGPNSAELDLERDALRRSVTSALSKVRSASSKLSFHELLRDELASTGARLELMDELGPRPAAGAPGNQPSAPLAPAQGGEPPQASAPPAAASAPALHELQDPQETSDEPGAAPVVLSRPLEPGETGSVGAAEVVSAAVPSYDYGAVEGVPAVISPRAEQRLEQRQSLLSRLFGRFSPGQKQEQQQQHHQQQPGEQAPKEGSVPPLHFNPLGRSTALIRVRAWEQSPQQQQQQGQGEQQQQQPDGEPTVFIPTEEVALVDLDDLWTVVQPEVRFDPMPEEGLVLGLSRNNSRADGSQLLLDNEHELKEGLVSAEGGRVVARANPKHQVRQAPQAYQSMGPGGALEVIEPSRIQGDDDGFLIVDDALVDRALADFLAQLFLENQGRNRRVVRNLTPDQLKDLVRGSIERVSADYDEGTWASLWRWAKLLYTVYGWGSTALSLYQRPFIVRLVVRSAWSVARWVIVLVL